MREKIHRQAITAYRTGPWVNKGNVHEAPATLITEGVHNGSHGPVYWAAHILKKFAHLWNNIPLVLGHPMVNGNPVGVHHSREIEQKYIIGNVVGGHYDEQKRAIKATVQVFAHHAKAAEAMRLREVSVGVFAEETSTYGQHRGKQYRACAIAMQPDHAAILPEGQVGACSWQDGCGIRIHQGGYPMHDDNYEYHMASPDISFYQRLGSALVRKPEPEPARQAEEKLLPPCVRD